LAKSPSPVKQATRVVKAQYKPIDYALRQARRRSREEQAALGAAGQALIRQLQAGVAPAGQAYDQAVAQQQDLARGAADLLASTDPTPRIQSDLAAINAPPEQQAQLANQLKAQFPGQGAVLNVEQGTVPGASLIAQKAATQQFLAGLPTLAALSGQESLRGLLARSADTRDKLYEARLQAAGQIPGLALDIQQKQEDRAFQAEQAALSRAFDAEQARLGRMLTPYEKAQIAANQPTALDRYKAKTDRISARNARRDATSGGGLTPYQQYEVGQNRTKAFESTRTKVHQALGLEASSGGSIFGGGSTFNVPKGQRQRAYSRLYSLYAGPLIRAGVAKGSVKAMLNTALNEAGYALPGKRVNARGQRVR